MKPNAKYKQIDNAPLSIGERWLDSFLVTYPVSISYNGGTIINEEWFQGYQVAPPKIPDGFELIGIGCGHQLNAHPPYATAYLRPLHEGKISKKELKIILDKSNNL